MPGPDESIAAAWERGRAAHPDVAVTAEELAAFVGEPVPAERHAADLVLACGCAKQDPAALAALEREAMPAVERGLRGVTADRRRDVMQLLREQMLVVRDGRAGIAAYDGRAPLAIWLRVCATRLGMRQANRDRRSAEIEDAQLEHLAPGVPDPQLAYLKQHYGEQFRTAFGEAVASLAPRERNLLRHAVIDGLGIDQIAAIYHVHRATAARQLNAARQALVEATRERMRAALRISEPELESILRMIMSDVTLRQELARRPAQESE